jgi:hypothetical protein
MPAEIRHFTGIIPAAADTRLANSSYAMLFDALRFLVNKVEVANEAGGTLFINTIEARTALYVMANPSTGPLKKV